jgi:predicted acyl esterase
VADGTSDRRAVERRDDVCTDVTFPLSSALELVGPVRADRTMATDAPDADVVVTLVHVSDDGAYQLASGIRRLRYRLGRNREASVPDGPVRVTVDMWDAHHRVPAGDRLGWR